MAGITIDGRRPRWPELRGRGGGRGAGSRAADGGDGSGGAGRRSAAVPAALSLDNDQAPTPFSFPAPRSSAPSSSALLRSLSDTETNVRATAAVRRVQRDLDAVGNSVAAYYTAPERQGGRNTPGGTAWNDIDWEKIGQILQKSLEGAKFVADGRELGRLTLKQQNDMGRAFGTA